MCKCKRIIRNVSLEKCSKIALILNLSLILLNITIIFFTSLCFIEDKYEIIQKAQILTHINIIINIYI